MALIDTINGLEPGLELDWYTTESALGWAILDWHAPGEEWAWPSLITERLRRQIGEPSPFPGSYPTYAQAYTPNWSGEQAMVYALMVEMGISDGFTELSDAEEMCKVICASYLERIEYPD